MGFVVLGVLVLIILIYVLDAVKVVSRILKKAEKDINSVGDITKEIIDNILGSRVFQFLFKIKRKIKK
ncbi:MAG: hypothetical protein A2123_00620 [Candidatus Zambryskibacteria bacterium GWB1_40_5]|nr:MAG: hypothetical protein A2123_00620 [Candidatus Zambryskibacteria bacterium GWB1_40_5]